MWRGHGRPRTTGRPLRSAGRRLCRPTRRTISRASAWRTLAQQLRGFLDIRLNHWTDASLADTAAMVCYGLLQALLDRWLPGATTARSTTPAAGAARHGQQPRSSDVEAGARRDAGAEGPPFATTADIVRTAPSPPTAAFRARWTSTWTHWGFRYSGELMLTQPSPERPRG